MKVRIAGADGTRRSKTRATLVGGVLKRFTRNSKENTMSPMREKTATIANETLEKSKAAVEQTARSVEQGYTATVAFATWIDQKTVRQ